MKKIQPYLKTRLGTLFNEDCLRILKTLEANSVDCIFADPPFNIGKKYSTKINDNKTEVDYLEWTKQWLDECVRVLREGGSIYIFNLPKWNIHIASYLSQNLEFRHWISVEYKVSLPIPGKLYPAHYSLLYFTKGKPKTFNRPKLPLQICRKCGSLLKDYGGYKEFIQSNGGTNLTDVWTDISPIRHRKYKHWEYNELPEKILERILETSTSRRDVVLDPFGGSGTTYAVAERFGRRWLGCEIGNCAYIAERLKKVQDMRYESRKPSAYPRGTGQEYRHIAGHGRSYRVVGDSRRRSPV